MCVRGNTSTLANGLGWFRINRPTLHRRRRQLSITAWWLQISARCQQHLAALALTANQQPGEKSVLSLSWVARRHDEGLIEGFLMREERKRLRWSLWDVFIKDVKGSFLKGKHWKTSSGIQTRAEHLRSLKRLCR